MTSGGKEVIVMEEGQRNPLSASTTNTCMKQIAKWAEQQMEINLNAIHADWHLSRAWQTDTKENNKHTHTIPQVARKYPNK